MFDWFHKMELKSRSYVLNITDQKGTHGEWEDCIPSKMAARSSIKWPAGDSSDKDLKVHDQR